MPLVVYLTDLISAFHLESFYFIAIDLLVALYLVLIARRKCPTAVESVAAAYLLNPLMLLSCAAKSSSGLVHLTLMGAVYHAMVEELLESVIYAALGTYLAIHPISILAPVLTFLPRNVHLAECNSFGIDDKTSSPLVRRSTGRIVHGVLGLGWNMAFHPNITRIKTAI
jgi:hypothetical protein